MKNRRILITGASAGIGYETTKMLCEAGAEVIAIARRQDSLKELSKQYSNLKPIALDIRSSSSELEKGIGAGRIDVLINNAGLARGRESFENVSEAEIDEMLDTNVRALMRISRLVIPGMIERNDGDIVNIGSIAGLFAYTGGATYCATKFAVHALSQAWRLDFQGKNIRVVEICPGMVETEFSIVRYGGDKEAAKKVYQGMRPLVARDIAEAILWTLSRPRHVTIQNMLIMPTDQGGIASVHRR